MLPISPDASSSPASRVQRKWESEQKSISKIFGWLIQVDDEARPGTTLTGGEAAPSKALDTEALQSDKPPAGPSGSSPEVLRYRMRFGPTDPHIPDNAFPGPEQTRKLNILLTVPPTADYDSGGGLDNVAIEIVDKELRPETRAALRDAFREGIKSTSTRPVFVALKALDLACSHHLKPLDWPKAIVDKLVEALKMFQHERRMDVKWNSIAAFVGREPRDCWRQFKTMQESMKQVFTEEPTEGADSAPLKNVSGPPEAGEVQLAEIPEMIVREIPATTQQKGPPESGVESQRQPSPQYAAVSEEESEEGSEEEEEGEDEEVEYYAGPEDEEPPAGLGSDGAGQTVSLGSLETPGLGVVRIQRLKFTIICTTCGRREMCEVDVGPPQKSPPATTSSICPNCRTAISTLFFPEFVHAQNSTLGKFVAVGCSISDLLPSDYLGSCIQCDGNIKFPGIFTGVKRSVVCRKCHSKTGFEFAAVQIIGVQPGIRGTRVGGPLPDKVKNQRLNLTVGTPLPKTGTCSHYKKSFRWFRFPCCGMAYPCDICHDKNQNHPNERATRMICGHCSREQSVQNTTCVCGSGIRAERTAYWEGGKGCRDPAAMSRHDDKKYRLLARQQQQRKATAAAGRGRGRGRGKGRGQTGRGDIGDRASQTPA